jgi:hypothetical protein
MDELRAIEVDRFAQMLPEATLKGMTYHPQDLGYFKQFCQLLNARDLIQSDTIIGRI